MDPLREYQLLLTRRHFFGRSALGVGTAALAGLLGRDLVAAAAPAARPGTLPAPHLPAKAKRVIYLYQAGGPSHLETFDYKPKLAKMHDNPMP